MPSVHAQTAPTKPTSSPTSEQRLYELGRTLGELGHQPVPLRGWSHECSMAFAEGLEDGRLRRLGLADRFWRQAQSVNASTKFQPTTLPDESDPEWESYYEVEDELQRMLEEGGDA